MDEETTEALEGSITKWEGIVAGTVKDAGHENCPLCLKFNLATMPMSDRCSGCPVKIKTGLRGCKGTPYIDFNTAHCPSERNAAAKKEVDFLKSLRDEKITSLTKRNDHTYPELVAILMDHPEWIFRRSTPRPVSWGMVSRVDWADGYYTIVEVHNDLTWEQVEAGYPKAQDDPKNGFQIKAGGWTDADHDPCEEPMKMAWRRDEIRIDPDYDPTAKVVPERRNELTCDEAYELAQKDQLCVDNHRNQKVSVGSGRGPRGMFDSYWNSGTYYRVPEPDLKMEAILYWGMTAEECHREYKAHPDRWEFRSLIHFSGWSTAYGNDNLEAFILSLSEGRKRRKPEKPTVEQRLEAIEAQLVLGGKS